MRHALAVLVMALSALPLYAGEAGTIVAALPDEASECRYLTQLCEETRAAEKAADEANDKKKAVEKRAPKPYSGDDLARLMTATQALTRYLDALAPATGRANKATYAYRRARTELQEATKVVLAKHEQAPSCICWDVVGREGR